MSITPEHRYLYPYNGPKIGKNCYYKKLNDYGYVGHLLMKPDTNFEVFFLALQGSDEPESSYQAS